MRVIVALVPLAVALVAPTARAEETPKPEPTHWYGGQILLADLGSYTLIGAGALTTAKPLAFVGVASYLVTPLIIHGLHDRQDSAGGSMALRLLLPFAFAGLGYAFGHGDNGSSQSFIQIDLGLESAFVGAAIGMLTASMIDAVGLAREPVNKPASTAFAIGARPVRGGTVLTLGRAF